MFLWAPLYYRRMRGHRRNFSDGRITTSLTDTMGDDVSTQRTEDKTVL